MAALWFILLVSVDAEALWEQANQAYADGRYQAALDGYLSLQETGVDSGKLHYNLGNAYLKTNRLGKAVLHYYRAQRLLPGDEDVHHNLQLTTQMRRDPVIEGEHDDFEQSLDILLRRLPYSFIFVAALVLLVLAGSASLLLILRSRAGKWAGYVLVIAGVTGLLLAGVAYLQYRTMNRRDEAVVIAEEVQVLSGPSRNESVSFPLHEGIRCTILDSADGWYRIRLANGFNGWLPRKAVEII